MLGCWKFLLLPVGHAIKLILTDSGRRAQEGHDAVVKKHLVTNFIKRRRLKYFRVQWNKKKSKEAFCENLWNGMQHIVKD